MAKKGTNIYKRKDGRWEGRYLKGYDISGKALYGYVYGKSYTEAREKQIQAQADFMEHKPPVKQNKKRFSNYCDEWLVLNRSRVKKSTYVKYFNMVSNHIKPELGGFLPCQLNTVEVEAFGTRLLSVGSLYSQKGLSPKTVRDILTVLNSILKYIKKQPNSGLPDIEIVYPREPKKEMRILSKDEQYRFIEYLTEDMDYCKFGVLLALLTGMRIGEICALRWRNISVAEQMVKIEDTMQRLQTLEPFADNKTAVLISDPKSETSKRLIPLTGQAVRLCQKMKPSNSAAFVLTGISGEYMEPRNLQYRLKKYMDECGISGATFHTLRHTFATRCVEADFELKSLSEILGHASVQITLDRYVHSSLELKRENMRKLEAIGF
jgi:integrase